MHKKFKDRRAVIGSVIEKFLFVEMLLDTIISFYFTSSSPRDVGFEFDKDLLRKELSFEQKLRVLRRLKLEKKENLNFDKTVYKDLEWLEKKRNILVHNISIFEKETEEPKIYPKENEEIVLNEEFSYKFSDKAYEAERKLTTSLHKLFETRKQKSQIGWDNSAQ